MNRTETIRLRSVFDHHADQSIVDQLRATIVEDIHSLLGNYENFGSVTVADLDKDLFASMRKKYDGLLHYGVFSLPPTRPFINELIWKWTEATGKYVGCQYWSVGAKALFDREAVSAGGWPITVRQARKIERELSKKRDRTNAVRLTHEHVYPIKDIKLSLKDRRECVRKKFQTCLKSSVWVVLFWNLSMIELRAEIRIPGLVIGKPARYAFQTILLGTTSSGT